MARRKKSDHHTKRIFRESGQNEMFENSLEQEQEEQRTRQVECLGITFENNDARREYFFGKLREGLEELHEKLGGVAFTTVEDAVERMKSIERWPMAPQRADLSAEASAKEDGTLDENRLCDLAERMRRAQSSKDLLQRWKDEVGFPHGEIEDILDLSDPPYYTACPNPFLGDFIRCFGKPYNPKTDNYRREPFAADVTEGKRDPIYGAHSYHTKVPHQAIMRYILHYTEPSDVVFDGFCGTGMTGVAAQFCGYGDRVTRLGYNVKTNGTIRDEAGREFSILGGRRTVLVDICPSASLVSYSYNSSSDAHTFHRNSREILADLSASCAWMYSTLHDPNETQLRKALSALGQPHEELSALVTALPMCRTNYVVWSDVFSCPECSKEVVFWDAAVDLDTDTIHSAFSCPHCKATITKRALQRVWDAQFDQELNKTLRMAKQVPVLINYTYDGKKHEKVPDAFDRALIAKIDSCVTDAWFPTDRMPDGEESRRNDDIGLTHLHHYYPRRAMLTLATLWGALPDVAIWKTAFTGILQGLSRLQRFRPGTTFPNMILSGTLYVGSLVREWNAISWFEGKLRGLMRGRLKYSGDPSCVNTSTQSSGATLLPAASVDYIFTDPPFGGNLMYSELNFIWEAWLRVFTNNAQEAVTNKVQKKNLQCYQRLMTECFLEYYRILKPGRWMTVEFHNSKNSVWNAIQEALQYAGFVVADVRVLDKKQGSFKQITSGGSVKQDLIISAYRPNGGLEERFKLSAGTETGVWDFIRTHLRQLPRFVAKGDKVEIIAERQNFLLFDRMVAFHVQRGVTVPLSAAEFYAGLAQRFPERDGMYFLPEQVAEYDRKRMTVKEVQQLELFVKDEASAILWLRQQLKAKPQTFQEIHPQFMREIGGWEKHEKPLELSEMLGENFLRYDGAGEVPSQIHAYLSTNFHELRNLEKDAPALRAKAKDRWYVPDPRKTGDLEKLRDRALLREFEEYRQSTQRRLKVFRLEAVRAGFRRAWQERDYQTIITVARKIPDNVLQEDDKLLMWYDQAITRSGGN